MEAACYICNKTEQNALEYGEFLSKSKISVHYFCLLFSNDLMQRGKLEKTGIMRFQLADIKKLHKISKRTRCYHCKCKHATAFCAHPDCPKKFHYICGLRAGYLPQFTETFPIFCNDHYPPELLQPQDSYNKVQPITCTACNETMPPEYRVTECIPSCCGRGWSHTNCVRRFALAAGYYFGCIQCREKKIFRENVKLVGVYIPDREATWETSANDAIMTLRWRHSRCDAVQCLNESGRDSRSSGGLWSLMLCNCCASYGIHTRCARLQMGDASIAPSEIFTCPSCKETLSSIPSTSESEMSFADQTIIDDDVLNDCRSIDSNDDDNADTVIEISSTESSIHDSETYSKIADWGTPDDGAIEVDVAQSPNTQRFEDWLDFMELEQTDKELRKQRLRLLLGKELSLARRVRL